MNATQEFFGSGNSISIEARDENGLDAPVAGRHSTSTMQRALSWISSGMSSGMSAVKKAAVPVMAAVAVTASMGAFSMTPANDSGADANSKIQNNSQISSRITADTQAEGNSVKEGVNKLTRFEISQILLAEYDKNKNSSNAKINESKFGMSQKEAKELSINSISPAARKYISTLDVIDQDVIGTRSLDPSMMSMENKNHTTTCVMQVGGYTKELSDLLGHSIEKMSPADSKSLRRVVLVHEAGHCEQSAMLAAHNAGFGTNFAGQMDEFASSFKTKLSNGSVIDYSDSAKTLMGERYADSKAVLVTARNTMGHLDESSTASDRSLAVEKFSQDVSMIKKMRIAERDSNHKAGRDFDDHDTLHIVESLESTIIKNARDPAKWKDWSGKHLGEDQMAQTAGAITMGSMVSEKNEMALDIIGARRNNYLDSLNYYEITKKNVSIDITSLEKELVDSSNSFDLKNKEDPSKYIALDPEKYLEKFRDEQKKEKNLVLKGKTDGSQYLTQEEEDLAEKRVNKRFPASDDAFDISVTRNKLDDTRDSIPVFDKEIIVLKSDLASTKQAMESMDPSKPSIDEGLSDDSKSFSKQSHAFWSQSNESVGGNGRRSFLSEKIDEKRAEKDEKRAANLQSDIESSIENTPEISPAVKPSPSFMRLLGPRPTMAPSPSPYDRPAMAR